MKTFAHFQAPDHAVITQEVFSFTAVLDITLARHVLRRVWLGCMFWDAGPFIKVQLGPGTSKGLAPDKFARSTGFSHLWSTSRSDSDVPLIIVEKQMYF